MTQAQWEIVQRIDAACGGRVLFISGQRRMEFRVNDLSGPGGMWVDVWSDDARAKFGESETRPRSMDASVCEDAIAWRILCDMGHEDRIAVLLDGPTDAITLADVLRVAERVLLK